MTKPKYHRGFYVVAQESAAGLARVKPLVGPFASHRAARLTERTVREAIARHFPASDPLAQCNVTVAEIKRPIAKRLPTGQLDLAKIVDDDWCASVIAMSERGGR